MTGDTTADRGALGNNDLDLVTAEQFGREVRQPLNLALCKSVFDGDVLSLKPTELAQPLSERFEKALGRGRSSRAKKAYPVDRPRLLCYGNERRKREAESENDREPNQPHGPPQFAQPDAPISHCPRHG